MSSEQAASAVAWCTEDLAQLAATQYRIADQLCDTCRNYHALWPYHRVAGMVGGAQGGGSSVERILRQAFEDGGRKLLIAGAADTGLLALAARVGIPYDVDIVVIDRCRTPLELCRQFAQRWSLRAETLHRDLTDLDISAGFDVVLASSVLTFIAPDRRVDVLSRLRGALRPGGTLVHVFNVSARVSGEALPEYRADYSRRMLAEMERRGIPLPESAEMFTQRLDHYARDFQSNQGAFGNRDQVLSLHRRAGFAIVTCADTEMGLVAPWRQVVAKLGKQRFLIVAKTTPGRSGD
jgi:SAM-dependent methyltransferase